MSDERELEELRKRRIAELESQGQGDAQAEEQKAQIDAQKAMILRQILTPKARDRLARIKVARPEFAESIENQLISLASSRSLRGPITEEQLIEILRRLQSGKRESTIEFKRK
ncbi:MAG TPA: DNA-binding protein [candidate division Zixibacteria bacterium]|nr:DNA-binding protein [candidate division Zixibacteria bacterium]